MHTRTHTQTYIPHGNDRPVVVHKVVHHLESHLSLQVAGSHVHEVFNNKKQELLNLNIVNSAKKISYPHKDSIKDFKTDGF